MKKTSLLSEYLYQLLFSAILFLPSISFAQPVFNVNTSISPCDEYSTNVLQNPWDMSENADVNNFISNDIEGLSGSSFSSGLYNFTNTIGPGGHFYLVTPKIDNLQPVGGRWGETYPIDPRYRFLTLRMNATEESETLGLRVLWHRATESPTGRERTITGLGLIPVYTGFKNYQIDLAAAGSFDGTNPHSWSTGPLQGIGIYPFVSNSGGQIDYIRLDDPDTCSSTTVNYNSSTNGNNDLVSFYLDSDSDPTNGFYQKLNNSVSAAGAGSVNVNSLGLMPGSYKVVSRFDSDYAALERDNMWDMSESTDLSSTQNISGGTFGGGTFSGTTSGSSPSIFLDFPVNGTIDASKYDQLSIKVSRSVGADTNTMLLVWETTTGGVGLVGLDSSRDPDVDNVYHVDLSAIGTWTGSIKSFRLQLASGSFSGITFALDFFQVRQTGFVTTENEGTNIASAGNLVISNPPTIQILQPDLKGGELFRPWDMRSGDFGFSLNAEFGADTSFPNENFVSYLPDVRSYAGVRGDLFKVGSLLGNGDPSDFLTFPFIGSNNYTINADEYTNLCVKMTLDRDYDLALGSVTKHFYKRSDRDFDSADAWATIYDRWSDNRWYEYCLDAANHPTEDGLFTWNGTIESFRFDPHEFAKDSCCDSDGNPVGNPIRATTYYDYIRLAKRDRSYGKFALAYQVQDSDTATPTVSWLYSTTSNFASSTAIAPGDLSCQGQVCIWNTTGVANGNYYIKGVASDGANSNAAVSTSFMTILNGQGTTEVAPVLAIENPVASRVVCDNMQIKGYAVNNAIDEPVVAVQVFFDNDFQELVVPNEFSPASKAAFPARLTESGFNFTLPVTGLTTGAHNVVIRAYSSNGGVASETISVTKSSGCQDEVISDNSPAGVPVAGVVSGSTPTPVPSLTAPKIKTASINADGVMKINLTGLTSTVNSCNVVISAGLTADALTLVKSFPIANSNAKSGKYALQGKGVKVNKKKVKKFFLGARFDCSGAVSSDATKGVSPKTSKGAANITKVVAALKKKLKKA